MNAAALSLLESLARTTLGLAAAGVLAALLLRLVRSEWPTAHRAAWLLVLVIGWTFPRLPVAVPWYDAEPAEPSETEVAAVVSSPANPPVIDLAPTAADPVLPAPFVDLAEADSLPAEATSIAPVAVAASPEVASTAEPANRASRASATAAPTRRPFYEAVDWPGGVVAGWILGMSLCAGLWLVGYVRFVRLLRNRRPADDASQATWQALLAAAFVKRSIPLSVSDRFGPMLCCLPRGYELIVPRELWSELDGAGQGAILRHELAHYQRGDVWKSLLVRLLALPHWFNPVAWLAVRRFEEAAEWACDRAAIADEPATEYAKLLVQLGQSPHALGYGSAARGRPLAARVRRVLAGKERKDSAVKTLVLLVVGVMIVATSVVQLELVAKEPAADSKAEPLKNAKQKDSKAEPQNELLPPADPAEAVDLRELAEAKIGKAAGPDALQEEMLKQAARAYEAHLVAYEAQTVTMPSVYNWSLRWMQAAESAARNRAERIAASRDHVARMVELQKKIEIMFKAGIHGGEAKDYAAANFYLAEAKRHLADVEAHPTERPSDRIVQVRSITRCKSSIWKSSLPSCAGTTSKRKSH